jgi:hypothetical protein
MTTAEQIERFHYEHGWRIFWPGDPADGLARFPSADLEALADAGELKRIATIYCPDGHAWWVGPPADAPAYRECNQCDSPGDPEDYSDPTDFQYVMSDKWATALARETKECAHCFGSGREPVRFCECGRRCDADGYCDACATAAVERYKAEHGGRSPADEFKIRKTAHAEATEAVIAAAKRMISVVNAETKVELEAEDALADALGALERLG